MWLTNGMVPDLVYPMLAEMLQTALLIPPEKEVPVLLLSCPECLNGIKDTLQIGT